MKKLSPDYLLKLLQRGAFKGMLDFFNVDPDMARLQELTRAMIRNPEFRQIARDRFADGLPPVIEMTKSDLERYYTNRDCILEIVDILENSNKKIVDLHGTFGPKATVHDYVEFVRETFKDT